MLIEISIPIPDYYDRPNDPAYFLPVHFECEGRSPSKAEVIEALQKLHERDSTYAEYNDQWSEALESIRLVNEQDWKYVGGTSRVLGTNHFVEHPRLGKQSVFWHVLTPIRINRGEQGSITI